MELGSLSSEIMSGVLTAFAVLAAMTVALAVLVYIQARKAGRWVRTTLNRQLVNLAPGPGRDLVRMRARLDRCLQGGTRARWRPRPRTERRWAISACCVLVSKRPADGWTAQLEVISAANLSPSMLNAALKPLRAHVDAFERVATDLATIAATSIADVHGVELRRDQRWGRRGPAPRAGAHRRTPRPRRSVTTAPREA